MRISVRYFAIFREQRGLAEETLEVAPINAGELYTQLADLHRFTLPPEFVRAAINQAFAPMDTALADGDEVVFVAPVAGG